MKAQSSGRLIKAHGVAQAFKATDQTVSDPAAVESVEIGVAEFTIFTIRGQDVVHADQVLWAMAMMARFRPRRRWSRQNLS